MAMQTFADRHIGLSDDDIKTMLATLGFDSLDQLSDAVVPESILDNAPLNLAEPLSEEGFSSCDKISALQLHCTKLETSS